MDYAYRAFRGVKAFYNAINPATLSGAIDVVVVEQPDGEFKSTPFHVRFGKCGVFSHFDKFVDMTINGEEIDVKMKLGDSGVAYFVEECNTDGDVPEHMITSPLPEPYGNHPDPTTQEVLEGSAKKLEEGRSTSIPLGGEIPAKAAASTSYNVENEQSLSSLQRSQLWPFSLSAFNNRRNRSLPDLTVLDESSSMYDDVTRRRMDDTPVPKTRASRSPFLDHSKSQAFGDTKTDTIKSRELLRKKNAVADRIPGFGDSAAKESDSEISEVSSSVSPSPSSLDPLSNEIAEGALSDSEVDRSRSTPEQRSSDVTDWKWGEMPQTRENMPNETLRKSSKSSQPITVNDFVWMGILSIPVPQTSRATRSQKKNTENFALDEDNLERVDEEDGKCYVRSLRLSSDKLKSLNLVRGANECRFSITTKFQGTCWCTCNIYLYRWDEQLVISDVDGTITKSDVLGHVIPAIGGTWAHIGVADLYTRIKNNGYKMVYLSSRAIGQSHTTKQYLRSVAQDSKQLPDGPVLLSPNSVLIAFRREVIERKPEEFKIAALSDLKKLFPISQPFFAGFGNRETDVISYRAVDVPQARILIINPSGRVRRSDSIKYVSSYMSMANETVDYIFPPLTKNVNDRALSNADTDKPKRGMWFHPLEHSAFTHWKSAPMLENDVKDEELLAYEAKRKGEK